MKNSFSETERKILSAFTPDSNFFINDIQHKVILSGKPLVQKGECKTDIYVKTICSKSIEHEFKISVKQDNADFLENKISLERAKEILGVNFSNIIKKSTLSIVDKFEKHKLIEFKKNGPTIMMGWKFEFMNKISGEKSGLMELNLSQVNDIYSGKNLREDKRHAFINHKQVKDSGVADYILISKEGPVQNCQKYIDELVPISNYIKSKKIYFACKALNYRVNEKKWDGNRPLCVWVDWYVQNESLFSRLHFDNPLVTKGNDIGNNIEKLLSLLKLDRTNFTKEIGKIYKGF